MLQNKKDVTIEQREIMLDELELNSSMIHVKLPRPPNTVFDFEWDLLVDKLNAVPNGAKRSVTRWKNFMVKWIKQVKQLKSQANSENTENRPELDEMAMRLLYIVEEEESIQDIIENDMEDCTDEDDVENDPEGFLSRPLMRRKSNNCEAAKAMAEARRQKCLNIIFGNNECTSPNNSDHEKDIMQRQLDRLYQVSQQLENQIKHVQERIQMVKDAWACDHAHEEHDPEE